MKKDERCPHCGYCPHCGQADHPAKTVPFPVPYPYPVAPWPQPALPWRPTRQPTTITYGSGSITAPKRAAQTINATSEVMH